jgi:CHAD domain-containing protein
MTGANGSLEREVKLSPGHGLLLQDLGGEPLEPRRFSSTYYDSDDFLLARLGMTLRRRVEHGRSLWQLKLPRSGGRLELERLGGPAGPPQRIAGVLAAVLRGRELFPIAELRTVRHGVRLRADDATADVVLDEVSVMEDLHVVSTFDELEIELIEGDPRALRAMERAVRSAGAEDGDGRPKVMRVIDRGRRPKTSAGPQLQAFFERQYEQILAHDPGTRLGDDPEDLHDLRVAVRRLRAILRVAAPPLDRDWAYSLRDELDWLGKALGPVRDLDVMLDHLREEQKTLPRKDSAAFDAALARLERERVESRRSMLGALRSRRYRRLLDRLQEAAGRPRTRSARPDAETIAAAEFAKLRKAVRKLERNPSDEALHRVRIKGKRARYAAELAQPGSGKRVAKFIQAAKDFQDVTGEHQDAVVAIEKLQALSAEAEAPTSFAAGRIAEREEIRRDELRFAFPAAWRKLKKSGTRAWR